MGIHEGTSELETVDVARLGNLAESPSIESAVKAVREFLGFDISYVTQMVNDEQHFLVLRGDGESFGVQQGTVLPEDQTYCRKVLDGKLPHIIPDVAAEPEAASLSVTEAAGVGAFVSVPLHFSDGSLFGTLCAACHDRRSDIGDRELQFLRVFARMIADQFEHQQVTDANRKLEIKSTAAETLLAAVAARDSYTAEHSQEVVDLAVAVATRLGLGVDGIEEVRLAALLHDIGKISTPDAILQKPGPLDSLEWETMRQHPAQGELLINAVPELVHLAPTIRAEHERWDGKGYPDGLAGEDIPLASRITFASDAYCAMVTDRPYRDAMEPLQARRELEGKSGSQFDEAIVATLLEVLSTRQ